MNSGLSKTAFSLLHTPPPPPPPRFLYTISITDRQPTKPQSDTSYFSSLIGKHLTFCLLRNQRAVTRLANVRQLTIRRGKKLALQLSHGQPPTEPQREAVNSNGGSTGAKSRSDSFLNFLLLNVT